MATSTAVIENMILFYIFIVICNILITFRILDTVITMISSQDMITLFLKHQRSLDYALQTNSSSIPIITPIYQLLKFSLRGYLNRISEVTLMSISPIVLGTVKRYLWIYIVPDWLDDILELISMKWRNLILFIRYGEDFSKPPPLEVDETAVHPERSPAEEVARFHPKHAYSTSSPKSVFTEQLPPSSPSKKLNRKQSKQRILQQQGGNAEQVKNNKSAVDSSVWDPTWGVISKEIQSSWKSEETKRNEVLQALTAKQKKKHLPPVRW